MNQIEKISADIKSIESEIAGLNTKLMMLQYEKEALSGTSFELIKDKLSQGGFFLNKKAEFYFHECIFRLRIIYEPPVTRDRACAKFSLNDTTEVDVKWGEIFLNFKDSKSLWNFIIENNISIYLREDDYGLITSLIESGNLVSNNENLMHNLYPMDYEDVNEYMDKNGFYEDYNEVDDEEK